MATTVTPLPPTTGMQIVRVVKALFDAAPGYTYLTVFKDFANANGGIVPLANALVGITGKSGSALADLIVTNLKLTGDAATAAKAYLAAQFALPNANVGQIIVDAMNALASLDNDPKYSQAAKAFNASVNKAYLYSVNTANTTTDLATLQQADEVQTDSSGNPVTGNQISASSKSRVISGIDDSSLLSRNDRIVQALDASRIESDWRWQKSTVTYSFNTTIPGYYAEEQVNTTGWKPFPTDLMPVVDRIMSYTDSLLAIHLNKVAQDGDIRYNSMLLSNGEWKSHGYYPSSYWKKGGDILLNIEISPNSTTIYRAEEGFYGYLTILHELGHAMGLKHPFAEADDPPGDVDLGTNEDINAFSIMSYTYFREIVPQFTTEKGADGRSTVRVEYPHILPRSFMVFDIAALQALYGAGTTAMSGNNTYFFDPPGTPRTALYTEGAVHYPLPIYVTIWDSGGEDTIDLSATKHTNIVRLKPGSYSDIDFRDIDTQIREQQQRYAEELGTNYYDSWVRDAFTQVSDRLYTGENALGIAYGTVIENVIGGSGDDIFYDNKVDNKLFGGEGNDTFYLGEGGYDTIDGGQGQDTVIFPVSLNAATIQQDGTRTVVVADHFAAQLIGVETVKFNDGTIALV